MNKTKATMFVFAGNKEVVRARYVITKKVQDLYFLHSCFVQT